MAESLECKRKLVLEDEPQKAKSPRLRQGPAVVCGAVAANHEECAVIEDQFLYPPSFNLGISSHGHLSLKKEICAKENPYYKCNTSQLILPPQSHGHVGSQVIHATVPDLAPNLEANIFDGNFSFPGLLLTPPRSPLAADGDEVVPCSPDPTLCEKEYVPSQYEKEVDIMLDDILEVGEPPSESDDEEEEKVQQGVVTGRRFREPSEKEKEMLKKGGMRRSEGSEEWARKTFDAWRLYNGHPVDLSIEDLSELSDIRPFTTLLKDFMLSVVKQNGELYEPGTISSMLRAIGRLIRAREDQRSIENSKKQENPFYIITDIRYAKVRQAADIAVQRSVDAGLGKDVKRSDTISLEEEALMLASPAADISTPVGLNRRFGYFVMRIFFVRGVNEVRALNEFQFVLVRDSFGREGLRYLPGKSKNWKIDILHCNPSNMRQPVTCYDEDVINTYKSIVGHWPLWTERDDKEKPRPHPMFLQAKSKIRRGDPVWFTKGAWGKNGIGDICKDLADFVPSLKAKRITNKSARSTGISRMEAALAPVDKGMLQTGHRDVKSYKGYSRECKDKEDKVLQDIICGTKSIYSEAMLRETTEINRLKDGDVKAVAAVKGASSYLVQSCTESMLEDKEKIPGCEVLSQGSKDMAKFLKMLRRMEAEKRFVGSSDVGGGQQFNNLTNCNIYTFSRDPECGSSFSGAILFKGKENDSADLV